MSSDAAPRWLLAYVAFVIYGSLVPLEISLDALEAGDGFVKTGELLFDLGNYAALFL